MANQDTISALFGPGTGRFQINTLTLASTTETAFSMGTDSGTAVAVLTVPTGAGTNLVGSGSPVEFNLNPASSQASYGRKVSAQTAPPYFSTKTFDAGRPFRLRVSGAATLNAGVGNTVAVNIYQGTSATLGSDVKIAALTAGGAPSTSVNFVLEAFVQWDSTSQTLGGYYVGQVANTLTAQHALTNAASVTSAAGLTFVISGVFGNAGGGSISVAEFSVEQV